MSQLVDILKVKKTTGDVGVEIELMGQHLPTYEDLLRSNVFGWRRDEDPSIKGGGLETGEYVMKSPVKITDLAKEFKALDDVFTKHGTIITPHVTVGTHVHINVQELTSKQLITFICCYLIIDELMVDWCEPTRRGNHFCLRAGDAEYLIRKIVEALERDDIRLLDTDIIRYSSINLFSLFKYGSVEFRALEGTANFSRLETWCKMLHQLKEGSLKFDEPKKIFETINNIGSREFLSLLMGNYAETIKFDGWMKKMKNGVYLAQDIAYAKDWNEVNNNIFKKISGGF